MNAWSHAAVARAVVGTCGPARTLHIDAGDGGLVGELLALGSDARGTTNDTAAAAGSTWPGRLSIAASPLPAGICSTVIASTWLDELADGRVPDALAQLYRTTTRFAFLVVHASATRTRAWWESRCLTAGFRKHGGYYRINPYVELERDGEQLVIPLERVPEQALSRYPLAALERTRVLHMDMMRETGRRGDAHCIRYHIAARQVRPGDAVLDVACGFGYGSHILWHNSLAASVLGIDLEGDVVDYATANYGAGDSVRFERGDAQKLGSVADRSIDFIASFETIEHLPDPDAYLDELKRVLKPSGRVMICAPNEWVDETGKDPNPHHLHVYTWDRLRREVGARFLLEKGFVQTAGGALKHHHAPRAWSEVPLAPLAKDAEWILVMGMADPIGAAPEGYRETTWPLPDRADFHVLDFARNYTNPWLAKAMVTIGMRFEEPAGLAAMRAATLGSLPQDSADHGAALCGEAYALLAEQKLDGARYDALQRAITAYAALPDGPPHRRRWQISLLFVGGELARKRGETDKARTRYEECAARDPAPFSPLLGNRTLDALFRLASMQVAAGDVANARALLQRTVADAHRLASGTWLNVCGDLRAPIPAGLAELAQLMDKAARAAYALAVLDTARERPAVFAHEARGWFERVLDDKCAEVDHLRMLADAARAERVHLEERVAQLSAEPAAKAAHAANGTPSSGWRRWMRLLTGRA